MRKIMIICCLMTLANASGQGYNYNPEFDNFPANILNLQSYQTTTPSQETEYFTYTAPEDANEAVDAQRLANIINPQRVVFIKSPEKNVFSLTAEQLAKQPPLNIYVLQRQTDAAGLQSQLQEIRDQVAEKPRVQFIKYRTPEEIERAKQAIYNDFETIPGSSKFHQNQQTPVYEYDSRSQQIHSVHPETTTQIPVIFEIIKRPIPTTSPQTNSQQIEENLKSDNESLDYLPPSLN